MKVIYPGPGVTGAAAKEPTLHNRLGHLAIGENDVAEGPDLNEALASGLLVLVPRSGAKKGPSEGATGQREASQRIVKDTPDQKKEK